MHFIFLKGIILDDLAQPPDHLREIQHRSGRERLYGASDQVCIGNISEELFESRIGIRTAQLQVEPHDAVGGILRERSKSSQPRVGDFFQLLALTDIARHDHPQRLATMLQHPHRNLNRNDMTIARQQASFRGVAVPNAPANGGLGPDRA